MDKPSLYTVWGLQLFLPHLNVARSCWRTSGNPCLKDGTRDREIASLFGKGKGASMAEPQTNASNASIDIETQNVLDFKLFLPRI